MEYKYTPQLSEKIVSGPFKRNGLIIYEIESLESMNERYELWRMRIFRRDGEENILSRCYLKRLIA